MTVTPPFGGGETRSLCAVCVTCAAEEAMFPPEGTAITSVATGLAVSSGTLPDAVALSTDVGVGSSAKDGCVRADRP
jgi:hypothetical protein